MLLSFVTATSNDNISVTVAPAPTKVQNGKQ